MTEEARAGGEEVYRRLVEDGPVGIYVHDGATILYANPRIATLLGAGSPAELVGLPLAKIVAPEVAEAVKARIKALREGGPGFNQPLAGRLVRLDGAAIHVQVSAARCVFEGRDAFQVVVADVSEQRRAEEALREREAVMRGMLDAVEGAVSLIGVEGPGRFRIEEANPFAQRSLGRSREEMLGLVLEPTSDPRAPQVFAAMERVVATGRSLTLEVHDPKVRAYEWATTTLTPIKDAAGVVRHVLAVSMPIDERKRMEDALTAGHERYRALVEGHPDAILRVRRDGGVVDAHVPPGMGLPSLPMPAEGRSIEPHLEDVLPAALVAPLLPAIARALSDEGPQRVEGVVGDTPPRALEARVARSGADEVTLLVRDTSDVRAMQQRLVIAERMASLGTLSAGVAHEINNPLSFVVGNHEAARAALERAMARASDRPDIAADLREISSALRDATEGAERVRHTVRDLKMFSRAGDEDAHRAVDLGRVVASAIHLAENTIRHRVRLETDLQEVPRVLGNEARLGQVVLNLLLNAADAVGEDAASRTVRASLASRDGKVQLAVADAGSGIAPEVLPRIFEPFFTTKAVGQGTGIGLSICHGIVTALGGEIRVASTVGKGTTFTVELPVAEDVPRETAPPETPAPPRRRARVLIVDDEPLLGTLMQRLLEREHDVVVVCTGVEALALIDQGARFDAVFCDLMMPQFTGMDVRERVARDHPELLPRIVFMTGGAVTGAAREFLKRHDPPRLDKPFGAAELKRALHRVLDEAQPA